MTMATVIKSRLLGAGLHFQRFSSLLSWQHESRHGAGEGAQSCTSRFAGRVKRETGLGMGFLKLQSPGTHQSFQIMPLPGDQVFKSASIWPASLLKPLEW